MRVGLCLLFFAAAGFAQVPDSTAQQQADVGPTILSPTDMQVPAQVAREKGGNSFDYFLYTDGFYSTGVQENNQGPQGGYGNSPGFDVGGGLDLRHSFRRGRVVVQYFGSWRQYTNSDFYNGYRQGLNFTLEYNFSRRLQLLLREGIATSPNGTGAYQFSQSGVAGTTGLAGETRVYITTGTLVYQQTARLSYDLTGEFYASQYRPVDTGDSLGGMATVSVNYRTSKKATISLAYSYSHFTYSQASEDISNNQTLFATYAYAISPRTQFAVSGGATSADITQGLPVGEPPVLEAVHSTTNFPYFAAHLSHQMNRLSASVQVSQRVLSGNGYLGASKALTASGTLGYTPSTKWALSGTAGYEHLTALGTIVTSNANSSGFASISFNYKLSQHFGLKSSFHYSLYDYYGNVGSHPTSTLSFGFTFNSGDRPILFF